MERRVENEMETGVLIGFDVYEEYLGALQLSRVDRM